MDAKSVCHRFPELLSNCVRENSSRGILVVSQFFPIEPREITVEKYSSLENSNFFQLFWKLKNRIPVRFIREKKRSKISKRKGSNESESQKIFQFPLVIKDKRVPVDLEAKRAPLYPSSLSRLRPSPLGVARNSEGVRVS